MSQDNRSRGGQDAPSGDTNHPKPRKNISMETSGQPYRSPKTQKRRKSRRKAARITGIVVAVLVVALGVTAYAGYRWVADQLRGEDTQDGTLSSEVKSEDIYPEYTGKDTVNMLICGLDYDNDEADGYQDPDNKVGNTDMILYLHYDTEKNQARFMQIPRDTFVGEEFETGGTGKINGLYPSALDENNRMDALAKCVSQQLKLPVDYYVTIDMDAVKELIDQPPGYLSVYVPMEVNDPENPEAVIPEGWRDFTSNDIEWFLRNRYSTTYNQQGDIMRLQMQQSVYSALFREFKRLAPSDLLMWMRVLLHRVNTDMDPIQIGGLAQKALSIEGKDITFVRPPVTGGLYGNNSVVCLVPDETAELLNTYFRPQGEEKSVEELDIQTLPAIESVGVSPASIRSMADVQGEEEDIDLEATQAAQDAKGGT